jgi:hypothetical protein
MKYMKHSLKKCITLMVIFSFLMALAPLAAAAENKVGTLRGFVYGDDGKKPLSDAVVLIRDTTTERTFQSAPTPSAFNTRARTSTSMSWSRLSPRSSWPASPCPSSRTSPATRCAASRSSASSSPRSAGPWSLELPRASPTAL